ncbi:unnamed protein product [Rotaria magnacalcarata]
MHETDKDKTAFITQDALWEFNVLPQGIMNGSPTFQRTMHNLLSYGRWDYVMVYLDDILIFSCSFNEHTKHLNEILSILAKANFQVNPDKCCIAVQEIDFLSHTINEQFIKPNGNKITAIIDLPAATTFKEANEFLGKINWYRKFIPDFARIAAPLHTFTIRDRNRISKFEIAITSNEKQIQNHRFASMAYETEHDFWLKISFPKPARRVFERV